MLELGNSHRKEEMGVLLKYQNDNIFWEAKGLPFQQPLPSSSPDVLPSTHLVSFSLDLKLQNLCKQQA